ncbi:DNA polymerase III subunit beta [Oceanobacillus alkalisoli]|uniref:DNA polymerase III subunit beta n=1 Tax=Oceanobacillus alkalisoli TaxID=2925113 RepID=UPI001EF0F8E6|nr:DNA polymerase III subunit beta [Oceanobacillus alkalisoli]MCF3944012.1 DNA polymerase III subunit beta [Oceanobacillus alkalisoli]MCG5103284.1 DNA polymerase III subunit beta [Oceanobacillus alkalisoli]
MKFTIKRDLLITAVQDVMKAITPRPVIPILSGMKVEASIHGITLSGSDSDISIESFIPSEDNGNVNVENIEPGTIVLQARYFPDIVRKLPQDTVDFIVEENHQVKISSGKSEFTLVGQSAEEYPHLPRLEAETSFEMPIPLFKNMIKQTVFAVSTMETRPILTGVNIKLENNELTFTATDSHRLAMRKTAIEAVGIEFHNVVVPGKSLNELNKILDDTEETVEINVTNNQILFRTKHLSFLSRLLDGNYPETSRLIPEERKTRIVVNTKELLNTIDRASLLAREERNNVVKLTTQESSIVEITSNSPEVGNVHEEIVVETIEGEELKISFSSKYMMDALKSMEYDEVIIDFTGAMRPFVLIPKEDDSILQLILPVRTY